MTIDDGAAAGRPFAALLLALLACCPALAFAGIEIEFASVGTARDVLGTRDAFVERLSPFDRAARMKAGDDVSEAEFLAFVRQAPRKWTPDERRRLTTAFEGIEDELSALLPQLDRPVLLVKTGGAEEVGAGYTRGNAVVLPQRSLDRPRRELQRLLAHEIFHVVSRNSPTLRRALYETIGFHHCGEVALPATLARRRITNPDAPVDDHCIRLRVDGSEVWAVPVLLSRRPRYEPEAGHGLLDDMRLGMLLVNRPSSPSLPPRIVERGGAPVLVSVGDVEELFEQIGRNTSYIIHPEEILASNFELLVLGAQDVPTPDVLARMRRVLAAARR
ncbi:MAG: hypothetical protein JXB36_21115 [Gammaproteobacteria bacterium]|nr:hypothetical protein [Gammaproteobacteria bacterium]